MFQYSEKQFPSMEVTLSYVEGPPNGEPVILIHGVGSRWQPFLPIMPGLSEHFQVFAIDLRGHGKSGRGPGEYRLLDYTRDVHAFIAEKVKRPVVIYGHSLGALIAINLAAQHPQNVRKLILGDPPLYYHNTRIQDTFWLKHFRIFWISCWPIRIQSKWKQRFTKTGRTCLRNGAKNGSARWKH